MDKRTIEEIAVFQRSILSNLLNMRNSRAIMPVLESKYFGRYSAIFDWIIENPEYESTDEAQNLGLFKYLKERWAIEYWMEIADEKWYSRNPFSDTETLLRYYYFDARDSSKIIETLDEYNAKRDLLASIRTDREWKKYSGLGIWAEVWEELHQAKADKASWTVTKKHEQFGYETLDKYTRGFRRWTVTRITAKSGTGKSKLTYDIGCRFMRRGLKVMYVSLEVQKKVLMTNLISNWEGIPVWKLEDGSEVPDSTDFPLDQVEIVDDKHDWGSICEYVEKRKPDLVVIDFIQNIRVRGVTELFGKMEFLASEIQLLAIRTGTMVMDVSQVSSGGGKYKKGDEIPSKGSTALAASADIALVLTENGESDNFLSLFIAKNKFGPGDIEIALRPDFGTSRFYDEGEMSFRSGANKTI